MRIVVALGGRRFSGRRATWGALRADVRAAALALAPVASSHQLVLVYAEDPSQDNALGRLIEQELGNLLPFEIPFATLQMMIEIDPDDPSSEAPAPLDIFELNPIRWLLERGTVVICSGGGAATVYARGAHRRMSTVAAPVDIDRCAELLARKLGADLLVFTEDPARSGVRHTLRRASPRALAELVPADDSAAKLRLACEFVSASGASAAFGSIDDVRLLVTGQAGLTIAPRGDLVYAD